VSSMRVDPNEWPPRHTDRRAWFAEQHAKLGRPTNPVEAVERLGGSSGGSGGADAPATRELGRKRAANDNGGTVLTQPARVFEPNDRDRSSPMTNDQWAELLAQLHKLVSELDVESWPLRALAQTARRATGYSRSSPGFGERGMSRPAVRVDRDGNVIDELDPNDLPPAHSDIVGEQVAAFMDNSSYPAQRRMEGAGEKALKWLITALAEIREGTAMPAAEKTREQCAVCFAAKDVVTNHGKTPKLWIRSEGKCASCVRRIARNTPVSEVRHG
jgi:hypothetical protein